MKKINGKVLLVISFWLLIIGLLVYSRLVNLGWGLPYPMHPDERNIVNAIQQLNCIQLADCFNPHFFAYGQFPLYFGYLITYFLKFFDGDMEFPISFEEATISLRIISAFASIVNAIIIIKIIKVITKKESYLRSIISYLIVIFSPYAIQFAHFGTTESLLMMFYSLAIYLSIRLLEHRTTYEVVRLGLVLGLATATKVSSIIFLSLPIIIIFKRSFDSSLRSSLRMTKTILRLLLLTLIVFVIFSPHNLINFRDFVSSIRFESDVALGRILVFYTRQFINSVPITFQIVKIFPYTLGWPVFILGGLGFLGGLSWRDKKINLLRFAFLMYFIPSAIIYAKWSRFMAPVFPIITIFAILFLLRIKVINVIKIIIIIIAILPGMAYLSVYQNPDIRFQASDWIYKNIPNNSYILSETANVVDIPIIDQRSNIKDQKEVEKNYQIISFNFYDLDESPELQSDLRNHLQKANYIFVPSRRIFANHPKEKYPILNKYYKDLFSGKLGFEKVAEFESFPKICWPLTDKCLVFDDEQVEETWTVFDHPVIRIYKKIKSS